MSKVQIEESLFLDVIKFFIGGIRDTGTLYRIRKGLEDKLGALARHKLYTDSKTATTPEEREQARKKYLDEAGVLESFRW